MEISNLILEDREKKNHIIKQYINDYQVITLKANIPGTNKQTKEAYILLNYFDKLLNEKKLNVNIIGLDLKKDVIRDCNNIEGFDSNKYMLMCENLSYELFYVVSEPVGNSVRVGFFVENATLDKVLREEKENA